MTPAEEITAAAAKLRALATAASTDRYGRDTSTWTSHHVNDRDARLFGPDRVRIIRGGSSGAHGRGVHPHLAPAHADYIAAMHPSVGLALADWLEATAADVARVEEQYRDRLAGEAMAPHTLALARQISGGEQR